MFDDRLVMVVMKMMIIMIAVLKIYMW